jgi:hypothetical protein
MTNTCRLSSPPRRGLSLDSSCRKMVYPHDKQRSARDPRSGGEWTMWTPDDDDGNERGRRVACEAARSVNRAGYEVRSQETTSLRIQRDEPGSGHHATDPMIMFGEHNFGMLVLADHAEVGDEPRTLDGLLANADHELSPIWTNGGTVLQQYALVAAKQCQ